MTFLGESSTRSAPIAPGLFMGDVWDDPEEILEMLCLGEDEVEELLLLRLKIIGDTAVLRQLRLLN